MYDIYVAPLYDNHAVLIKYLSSATWSQWHSPPRSVSSTTKREIFKHLQNWSNYTWKRSLRDWN